MKEIKEIKETVKISLSRYEEMKREITRLKNLVEEYGEQNKALNEFFGERLKYILSPKQSIKIHLEENKINNK